MAVVGDVHKLFTCNNEHMIIESFVESASIDSPTILALIDPNSGFPILPDRCSYPFKVMKVTDLEYSMKSCRFSNDVIIKPFYTKVNILGDVQKGSSSTVLREVS